MGIGARVAKQLAGYRLEELVGRGGMAVVWRAQHVHLKRRVALKIPSDEIMADPGFRERFIREARLAASIHHPNLVTVYDAGEADGLLFIAMQYVEGGDLKQLLEREGRIPVARAYSYLKQVAAALDAAHEHRLVHRDVKPGNVLIEDEHCYLADFGLSKLTHDKTALTEVGDLLGTLHYAAPEQINGISIDHRADVYSLACVAFELLTGTVPFAPNSSAAVVYAHLAAQPPRLSERSPALLPAADAVLIRAMAKEARDRHASAGEFVEQLGVALGVAPRSALAQPVRIAQAADDVSRDRPLAPAPALALSSDEAPMFGREKLLDAMRARWRSATDGGKSLVFLLGDAGAGKTRLAAQFADETARDGACVLYGRCDEEIALPYQPFAAALRDYLRQDDAPREGEDLDAELEELARLIPEARRRGVGARASAESEGAAGRYWLFEAVASVLARAARQRPLLLVLDDLHWADRPTLLLLRHVLSHRDTNHMMILATHRSAGAGDALSRTWAALPPNLDSERLTVPGLDHSAITKLVTARLQRPVSASFLAALRRHTDGNPFFVKETLRYVQQLAADGDDEAFERALDRMGVPDGVAEVILRRLDGLSPATIPVLNAASVIGREFDLSLLEALLEPTADELLIAIEEAMEAGLVAELPERVDGFAFCHALVREAIYTRQSGSRRRRMHFRVGEALERLQRHDVPAAELAHHFFLARHVAGPSRAVRYCTQAAERAIESLAHEDAEAHYSRAIEALDMDPGADEAERCELLLALGRVQWQSSSGEARQTFLVAADNARRRGDAMHLAAAALGFGERYWETDVADFEVARLLDEALEAVPSDAGAVRARLLSRLAQHLYFSGKPGRAEELSAQALTIARGLGDRRVLINALLGRHIALLHVEHVEERLRLIDDVLELAARGGAIEAEAHQWRLYALMESGRIPEARTEQARLEALAEKLRLPLFEHVSTAWKAVLAQVSGQLKEAEELAHEAFDLGRRARVADASSVLAAMLFTLKREQGRATDVLARIDALPRAHAGLYVWRTALTLARLDAGDEPGARARYEQEAEAGFPVPRNVFWLATHAMLAETCAALGDTTGAHLLYERLLPHADRLVQATFAACWGSVERYLALLAGVMEDADGALVHAEAAVQRSLSIDAPLLAARARFDCAQALRARGRAGDRTRAEQLTRAALEVAIALGAEQLESLCAAALEQPAP